jgi:outer membrane receptor protein involved in Fe transport
MAFGGANSARSGGNMRIRGSVKAILVATAAVPAILWQTFALADDTGGLETVVVTAERRAEPIYDVPATITAISGEQLQNLGFTDMKSIIQMVPNTVLADDPENFETYINIRGIRQADINAEPNFGLYRNGFFAGGERANLGAYLQNRVDERWVRRICYRRLWTLRPQRVARGGQHSHHRQFCSSGDWMVDQSE